MSNLAIDARGLRKSFGDHLVLDGLDLAVPEGVPVIGARLTGLAA